MCSKRIHIPVVSFIAAERCFSPQLHKGHIGRKFLSINIRGVWICKINLSLSSHSIIKYLFSAPHKSVVCDHMFQNSKERSQDLNGNKLLYRGFLGLSLAVSLNKSFLLSLQFLLQIPIVQEKGWDPTCFTNLCLLETRWWPIKWDQPKVMMNYVMNLNYCAIVD